MKNTRSRPVPPPRPPAGHARAPRRGEGPRRELAAHAGGVEAEVTRVLDQVVVVKRELALEQAVAHLPELPLRARRLGGLGRVLRVRMALAQREVAEHETQPPSQALPELLDDRVGAPAMGTVVVAVLDQRDGRLRRPLRVVPLARRERERGRRGALAHAGALAPASGSSARRMPSAPGVTSTGET